MGRKDQVIIASLLFVFLIGLTIDWNFNRPSLSAKAPDLVSVSDLPEPPPAFEYRSEIIRYSGSDAVELDETLKRVGEVGWDLCTTTETTLYGKPCLLLLLKRPID